MTSTSCKLFQAHATTDASKNITLSTAGRQSQFSAVFGLAGTLQVCNEFQNGTYSEIIADTEQLDSNPALF